MTEDIEAAATVDEYATQPAILCSDTVTVKRYITHMAKDYYGDRNFWVYIYEANKEILGHPERTLPGTVVQIPTPASIPANPTTSGKPNSSPPKSTPDSSNRRSKCPDTHQCR